MSDTSFIVLVPAGNELFTPVISKSYEPLTNTLTAVGFCE